MNFLIGFRWRVALCFLAVLLCPPGAAWGLQPDQIALVVNSNVPASRKLAEFYAAQRHVPDGRIIDLALKASSNGSPVDDIAPGEFDDRVIPGVKNFLTKNALDKKVTCLVTFWGVPLRIGGRPMGEAEKKEAADLKANLEALRTEIEKQVKSVEELAVQNVPNFQPGTAADLDSLARRGETALNAVLGQLSKIDDLTKRSEVSGKMMALVRELAGQPAVSDKLSQPDFWPLAPRSRHPMKFSKPADRPRKFKQSSTPFNPSRKTRKIARNCAICSARTWDHSTPPGCSRHRFAAPTTPKANRPSTANWP